MMSILKEECNKVGLEMHTQKTQVMTNGISDLSDNRRQILNCFNDKQSDETKTKKAKKEKRQKHKKQTKTQRQSPISLKREPHFSRRQLVVLFSASNTLSGCATK